MKERRDVSRQIGIYTYTRYFVRQQLPDGRIVCVYCGAELGPGNRCLDHINNKAHDNRPDNLVAACVACNEAAGQHDERGLLRLCERVAEHGADPDPTAIAPRLALVLAAPLPSATDERVQMLAWEWFSPRIKEQRRLAAARRPSGSHGGALVDEDFPIPF